MVSGDKGEEGRQLHDDDLPVSYAACSILKQQSCLNLGNKFHLRHQRYDASPRWENGLPNWSGNTGSTSTAIDFAASLYSLDHSFISMSNYIPRAVPLSGFAISKLLLGQDFSCQAHVPLL